MTAEIDKCCCAGFITETGYCPVHMPGNLETRADKGRITLPLSVIQRAVVLFETFAQSGMEAFDAGGERTPNARMADETAAAMNLAIAEQLAAPSSASGTPWTEGQIVAAIRPVVSDIFNKFESLSRGEAMQMLVNALRSYVGEPKS